MHISPYQQIKLRFNAYIDRKMPLQKTHQLNHKNIFIFPSWFGITFIAFSVLLFILGTNYQNNLIILMSFLVASLFTLVMLHSYSNLAGLTISASGTIKGYVGQSINLPVCFTYIKDSRALNLSLKMPQAQTTVFKKVEPTESLTLTIKNRGVFKVERMQLMSEFPLGLFRTWTYLKFPITFIVYPSPLACQLPVKSFSPAEQSSEGDSEQRSISGEDFYELSQYRPGDPLSQVAWKQVAKGRGWQVKRYATPRTPDKNALKLQDMPSDNIETKLSHLCFLALEYHQANLPFSMELADYVIPVSSGKAHLNRCLEALARWDVAQGKVID